MKKRPLPTVELSVQPLSVQPSFINEMHTVGCALMENVPLESGNFTLELVDFLEEKHLCVSGERMLNRAKQYGNLTGQLHAELLLSQQQNIPKKWRKYHLVFAGTFWYERNIAHTNIPFLKYDDRDDSWSLHFFWFYKNESVHMDSNIRLVRIRK
jgi:hypothetical protein